MLAIAVWCAGALPAWAQSSAPLVGLLHVGDDHVPPSYPPILEGLKAAGYRDGVNIRLDFRNARDESAAEGAARELVAQGAKMIIAFDQEACFAARSATAGVPIVMINAANPLVAGFAKSLAAPGGNMTGFAGRPELPAKELEIFRELAPKATRALLLFDSHDPASVGWRNDARNAAGKLGITLAERDVSDPAQLKAVFAKLKPKEAPVVLFASNAIRHRYQKIVLQLANEHGMAMIGSRKDVVEQGALFAYSYDFSKVGSAAVGRYIVPVLKGADPGKLPIEEVTDYELVINRAVAAKHGWPVPASLLLRASKIF